MDTESRSAEVRLVGEIALISMSSCWDAGADSAAIVAAVKGTYY
jgi:hypothetical protein